MNDHEVATPENPVPPIPADDLPEDPLARPMFWIAFGHLLLFAGLIHRAHYASAWATELTVITYGLVVLWSVIAVEAVFRFLFLASDRRKVEFGRMLLYTALPPTRMAAPSLIRPGQIWLPFAGWRDIDRRLEERLDRAFAGPMIIFALMVIPLLAFEYFQAELIRQHELLRLTLHVSIALIWVAFTLELVLKATVAWKPVQYLSQQWVDVAIVVIPMFTFLLSHLASMALVARLLRVARVLNPQYITRLGKVYRLRGVAGRAWASFLTLNLLDRLLGRDPAEATLRRMLHREQQLERELAELRERIAEMREVVSEGEVVQDGDKV